LTLKAPTFKKRALPDTESEYQLVRYVVNKEISAYTGRAMAWFGYPGGSAQYKFKDKKIRDLIANDSLTVLD